MSHEIARDSEDLLYYALRGAEKQYQLTRLRVKTRGLGNLDPARIPSIQEAQVVQNKFEIAKSDCEDVLQKYAGKVAIAAPLTHVRSVVIGEADIDIVMIEGTLTKVDYKKTLFKVLTDSGTVEIKYADFVLHDGCTYPSPENAIDLEFAIPN